jgi:hypothetical protein
MVTKPFIISLLVVLQEKATIKIVCSIQMGHSFSKQIAASLHEKADARESKGESL